MRPTLQARRPLLHSALAKRLAGIMLNKQSNLCIALDAPDSATLLKLAQQLAPMACILKTHVDLLPDFTYATACALRAIAHQYDCLLFEDRKFADIGQTNQAQFQHGPFALAKWVDLITVHSVAGLGAIQALADVCQPTQGLLLLGQMSCQGHLMDHDYLQKTKTMAQHCASKVVGLILQQGWLEAPGFFTLTPGVHLTQTQDKRAQQYRTPQQALVDDACDVIIVGRGITQAASPLKAAIAYQKAAWQAAGPAS